MISSGIDPNLPLTPIKSTVVPPIVRRALIGLVVALTGCDRDHPSDDQLRAQFSEHRSEFEQVLSMLSEDEGVWRIDDDWLSPEGSISPSRAAEYRKLFNRAGFRRGIRIVGPGEVEFLVSALGLVTGGSTKGILFSANQKAPLFENLNSQPPSLESLQIGYVEIEPNWYLFYMWDD